MPNAKQNLVIVESPSKAKTIGKYLGPDYQVKASMGHLRDLAKSTLSVDIEHDFEPEYYPLKGKEEIISELQKAAKHADRVYLATDPDREGEAISWHLKYLLSIPDDATYRVTFNEITRGVVQESIQHPRPIDQNLVDAQQARRVLDRIVGYQLSPLLWRKIRKGLSAGRVQSVATRLVVDRENEIRAFQPQEYWLLDALLDCGAGTFTARFYGTAEKKMDVPDEATADKIIAAVSGVAALLLTYMMPSLRTMFTTGSAVALALFTAIAAVLSVVAGLRSKSFTLGCLSFAGCCVALTALFLLKSSWLTEAFSAVLSALCLFTPFEEFVNSSFSIPTLVYYLTVAAVFLFFTAQGLEKRRWN